MTKRKNNSSLVHCAKRAKSKSESKSKSKSKSEVEVIDLTGDTPVPMDTAACLIDLSMVCNDCDITCTQLVRPDNSIPEWFLGSLRPVRPPMKTLDPSDGVAYCYLPNSEITCASCYNSSHCSACGNHSSTLKKHSCSGIILSFCHRCRWNASVESGILEEEDYDFPDPCIRCLRALPNHNTPQSEPNTAKAIYKLVQEDMARLTLDYPTSMDQVFNHVILPYLRSDVIPKSI